METLKTLLEKHPEWADLPIVVYQSEGRYDYVGAAGLVYEDEDEEGKVLVFAPN